MRELANYLGVDKEIIDKKPTAGLWKGQTDENELGYTYDDAEIIQNGYDQGFLAQDISEITDIDIGIILDVKNRHINSEHKRTLPETGKVTIYYE